MTKKIILGLIAICGLTLILIALASSSTTDVTPWPEYEPVDELLISSHLFEFGSVADELIEKANIEKIRSTVLEDLNTSVENWDEKKKKLIGVTFLPMAHSNVWLRDFGPVNLDIVQKSTGFSELGFADLTYQFDPTLDDILPWQLSLHLRTSLVKTPFILDGGNFIATRDHCFLSDHFVVQQGLNDPKKSKEEIKAFGKMIEKEFGCEVRILSDSPHAHVDMFLKAISADTLLVSEIPQNLIDYLTEIDSPHLQSSLIVKNQLDKITDNLSQDFKIYRIPMPTPIPRLFRNYTNSILLGTSVIMPSYSHSKLPGVDYGDEQILESIEESAQKIYESLGLKVSKVNSDKLIAGGGALHCVTLTLPKRGINRI